MRLYCILLYVFILSGLHAQQAENREYRKNQTFIGNDSDIMVVSHRADWRNAPENSLQGIQNCIDMGVDMVEIDLKKTKDGHLVLIHDRTVDRTMNGKGKVEDYTLAELKAMQLKNGVGCKTRHQIPTLEEVMLLCKGKVMVNIDKGYPLRRRPGDDIIQVLRLIYIMPGDWQEKIYVRGRSCWRRGGLLLFNSVNLQW